MKEFVAYIIKNLVSNSEAVMISTIEDPDSDSIKVEIHVAQEDIGKVIGRRGSTIHALRTIFRRVGARVNKKVDIDLIQPESNVINEEDEQAIDFEEHEHRGCGCSHQTEEVVMMQEAHGCCQSHTCCSQEEHV